jgi:hypothetical protein
LAIGVAAPNQLVFSVEGKTPSIVFYRSLDGETLKRLREVCVTSLRGYDDTWHRAGLDGVGVSGRFISVDLAVQHFETWSPHPGSPAHVLVAATLECVPLDSQSGEMEAYLECLRAYFDLGGQVRVVSGRPPRLRMSCWVHNNEELQAALASLPPEGDLIVDISNLARMEEQAMPMLVPLVRRGSAIRWLVSLRSLGVAEALGVQPGQIADYDDLKRQQAQARLIAQREQEVALEQERQREEDFSKRLDQARQKAIQMGIARADNVDRVIYDMPANDFRQHFAEFHLSRAFFKRR